METDNLNRYSISTPGVGDFDELTGIWEASVRATHFFLSEEDISFYKPLIRSEYLAALQLYCIKRDGEVAGFIGIEGQYIQMLFVAPGWMRQGIGRSLMQYVCENFKCNKVDVNEQNTQAVRFYTGLGFAVTRRSELDGAGKPYPILHLEAVAS